MTLTYERSISTTTMVVDGAERGTGNELCTTDTGTGFKRWDITSGSQVGSTATVSSDSSLCIVSTASALLANQSTSVQLVEIATGYVQAYSGGVAKAVTTKPQQVIKVGDYCFYTSNTTSSIGKFDLTTLTNSVETRPYLNGLSAEKLYTLANYHNGNFIAGTDRGTLVEMTSSLDTVGEMNLPYEMDNSYLVAQQGLQVYGISSHKDILFVTTIGGWNFQIHWPSKTVLSMFSNGDMSSVTNGTALCSMSSAGVIPFATGGGSGAANSSVVELDFTQSQPKLNDIVHSTSAQYWGPVGMQDGRFWCALRDNTIKVLTYAPTRTVDEVTSSLDDGGAKAGRIIRLIDTPGGAYVELDTAISTAGSTLPVTDGKTVIELALYGDGTDEKGALSTYST